ncbi:MAG: hypothetical protein LUK37_03580 [Clostridia bacterium]|nr:hypothetical protein [Clostridia bacterium]
MMTTSSSSCIIKPGAGIEVMRFVPPSETDMAPKRQEGGGKGPEHGGTGEKRSDPAPRAAGHNTADAVENAREEARQILQKANQMAGDILREAGTQAE